MLTFIFRRLLISIPTLLVIVFLLFCLLELAPGDPMAQVPLTVPQEVKEKMRQALGLGAPFHVRFLSWLWQFFVVEPSLFINWLTAKTWLPDTHFFNNGDVQRMISWQTRSPLMDIIVQRLPQTLWVMGLAYIFGALIAIPIGIVSAYRQYSMFDQVGTLVSMIGFSIPTFFTGPVLIFIFSIWLGWLPSIYDTTLVVNSWESFGAQVKQMLMPVAVLSLFNASQIARFMRASVLDNLNQDYVRTARATGMTERRVLLRHVLRNSLIPLVTILALNVPQVFAGAIITEGVFQVNGLGHLLIGALESTDIPMVQTLIAIFAILIILFNLLADVLYGLLDPRIRYD